MIFPLKRSFCSRFPGKPGEVSYTRLSCQFQSHSDSPFQRWWLDPISSYMIGYFIIYYLDMFKYIFLHQHVLNGVSNPLFDDWIILNHHLAQWIPIVNPIVAKSPLFDSRKKKRRDIIRLEPPSANHGKSGSQLHIYSLILCFRFPVSTVFAIKIYQDQWSIIPFSILVPVSIPIVAKFPLLDSFLKNCNVRIILQPSLPSLLPRFNWILPVSKRMGSY